MKQRKLWRIWATLDIEERKNFYRWLEVELFEKQDYVRILCRLMVPLSQPPVEEKLWEKLYVNQEYNDARMRKLISELQKWLKLYLAIESFKNDGEQIELNYLHNLNLRNLPHIFEKEYRLINRRIKRSQIKDGIYFQQMFALQKERQRFYIKYLSGKNPAMDLSRSFDIWWMYNKLILACNNEVYYRTRGKEIDSFLISEVLDIVENDSLFEEYKLIKVYAQIYRILASPQLSGTEKEGITQIIAFLRENNQFISYDNRRNIYNLLMNHYIGLKNQSNQSSITHNLFELYDWGIREKFVLRDNVLSWKQFKNIITVCLQEKEFDLIEHYLRELLPYLPKEDRREAEVFAQAGLQFGKQHFLPVIQLISTYKFSNPVYEIPARIYLLQSHYEVNHEEMDWLIGQLESLEKFIKIQKLSTNYKSAYLGKVRFFKKMLKSHTYSAYEKMYKHLIKNQKVDYSYWLEEKLQTLMRKGRNRH